MRSDIRKDFPILKRRIEGKQLVYLDNAATTQKPIAVIDAMANFYKCSNANVHRGIHTLSEEATTAYETARNKVAKLINAPNPDHIIFTRNATEAINLVSQSWGKTFIGKGDVILLTRMEHHANLIPWQQLAKAQGARIAFIDLDKQGRLQLNQIKKLLQEPVKIVSLTHVSNVLGTINPVAEITSQAHEAGAVVMLDGAQAVPHMPVNVFDLDCDFMAFSGHKMLGPTGIGILYGKRKLLNAMPPFMTGGEMIEDVTWENATWSELPWKFEAGTPCIAQAVGLAAAVEYLQDIGLDVIREHEYDIVNYAFEQLKKIENLTLYGPGPDERSGVISFNLAEMHPHDLASLLDEQGVAIRAGHHCAQPLVESLGVTGTARASFYFYNTRSDVDALVDAIQNARKIFGL